MKLKTDEKKVTFEEYLTGEELATEKHELIDGEVYAMVGASYKHSLLVNTLHGFLFTHFQGKGCTALTNDQMVSKREESFAFYPDIVVVCGKPEFHDEQERALINPRIVIEVLSPSTERNDRGYKAYRYREIESLEHYVIVWQDLARIENHYKDNGWRIDELRGIKSTLTISAIDFSIPLVELYEGVL